MSGEAHLYNTIAVYQNYKQKLLDLPIYTGFDDFSKRQAEGERRRLEVAVRETEKSLVELVNRYHPELAGEAVDVIIAELMEMMPKDNVRLARIINARGNGMSP